MSKKILPINFKFETEFGQLYTLSFYRTRYITGNTCLRCNCTEDGTFYEPYATISKNLSDLHYYVTELEICVDVNNIGAKLFHELISLGILTYTHRDISSGYCTYPICIIDKEWFNNIPHAED